MSALEERHNKIGLVASVVGAVFTVVSTIFTAFAFFGITPHSFSFSSPHPAAPPPSTSPSSGPPATHAVGYGWLAFGLVFFGIAVVTALVALALGRRDHDVSAALTLLMGIEGAAWVALIYLHREPALSPAVTFYWFICAFAGLIATLEVLEALDRLKKRKTRSAAPEHRSAERR